MRLLILIVFIVIICSKCNSDFKDSVTLQIANDNNMKEFMRLSYSLEIGFIKKSIDIESIVAEMKLLPNNGEIDPCRESSLEILGHIKGGSDYLLIHCERNKIAQMLIDKYGNIFEHKFFEDIMQTYNRINSHNKENEMYILSDYFKNKRHKS